MKKHKGSRSRNQGQSRGNQTKKRLELQRRARARGQAEHQYSCHERKRAGRSRVPAIAHPGASPESEVILSAVEQVVACLEDDVSEDERLIVEMRFEEGVTISIII